MEITFLDVGQGDAAVIRSPDGSVLMIDAGAEAPLRALSRLGVDSIDLLVATHAHPDHIGGMPGVLTARPVRRYLGGHRPSSSEVAQGVDATLNRISGVTRLAPEGQRLQVGDLSVEVLPSPTRSAPGGEPATSPSLGLLIRHGSFVALFPGDAQKAQLAEWTEAGRIPPVTLLKASHHGSEGGFTVPFLDAAAPELVVISVGENNRLGHPRPEALTAYRSVASEVLRTDLHGFVTVRGFPDGSHEVLTGSDLDGLEPFNAESGEGVASITWATAASEDLEAPGSSLGLS
ncbi:MAG: MBL fold metallo-hydrolase, partial [Longimicrobiales bacterium]|nr:MBL fold metallo-hydrolase [Longimicrobiales bacterium]